MFEINFKFFSMYLKNKSPLDKLKGYKSLVDYILDGESLKVEEPTENKMVFKCLNNNHPEYHMEYIINTENDDEPNATILLYIDNISFKFYSNEKNNYQNIYEVIMNTVLIYSLVIHMKDKNYLNFILKYISKSLIYNENLKQYVLDYDETMFYIIDLTCGNDEYLIVFDCIKNHVTVYREFSISSDNTVIIDGRFPIRRMSFKNFVKSKYFKEC